MIITAADMGEPAAYIHYLPTSLTSPKRAKTDGSCHSVTFTSSGILLGSKNGLEIRDHDLNLIDKVKHLHCLDVKQTGDNLIVFSGMKDNSRKIHEISLNDLTSATLLVEYPDKSNHVTHLGVSTTQIAAVDRTKNELSLYDKQGTPKRSYQLEALMQGPSSVLMVDEDHILVTDNTGEGALWKYRLGDELELVWKCENAGKWVCVDEVYNLIYTCTNYTDRSQNKIRIISPEGEYCYLYIVCMNNCMLFVKIYN